MYFVLYESSFTFIEERRPNKYCACEVNLSSYMKVFSLMDQNVNLARKKSVQNVGCVFTHFCGGHKNNFPIRFRSSFNYWKPLCNKVSIFFVWAIDTNSCQLEWFQENNRTGAVTICHLKTWNYYMKIIWRSKNNNFCGIINLLFWRICLVLF